MKKEIKIYNGQDQTREIRELFSSEESSLHFLDGEIIANGMLPEDYNVKYGDTGIVGIIRIDDKEDIDLEGSPTIFKITKDAIPDGYVFDRDHKTASVRSSFKLKRVNGGLFKKIILEGINTEKGDKKGFPVYDPKKYAEHAWDLEGCKNITFDGCGAKAVFGDGFYLRQGQPEKVVDGVLIEEATGANENIKILNCTVDGNGRQTIAIISGKNILVDNFKGLRSRRSGIDFEGNSKGHLIDGAIVRNSYFNCSLYAFPMGGNGIVQNVLIENNVYRTYNGTAYVQGHHRENIIFRGNRREDSFFGSILSCYSFKNAHNVLIENEYCNLQENRYGKIIYLENCTNVTIRNNDFPNAEIIALKNTYPSEVKVYGNKQDLKFVIVTSDTSKDLSNVIDIEEYDVAQHGEPDVPQDPTWTGIDDIFEIEEPEAPVEEIPEPNEPPVVEPEEPQPPVEPIPEPEEPTDPAPDPIPTPEPEPPIEKPEKKPFYKQTGFLVIGGIALVMMILSLVL